ncbi:MAG TPA: phosphoenolpyruvate carboxylase, partial [Cyanothece sp. UBA12306]|nr:phosphoenolpyruvate carboxylase [Cyanothece sp. UBA12306]
MSSLLESSSSIVEEVNFFSTSDLFLRQRLKLVEDRWEAVLRAECGQELVDLLKQLRTMCSPEGQVKDILQNSITEVIEQLELNEAIRAARAFALYFQLINIVEQHYEQRDQQLTRRANYCDLENKPANGQNSDSRSSSINLNVLEKSVVEAEDTAEKGGRFHWIFPHLKELNVPPQQIQRLLNQLDIRLVFTAQPTEIVRHTIRRK